MILQQVIFSGIQPTGNLHLGNYLGALLPWAQLQKTLPKHSKAFYSIADLHSLTSSSVEATARQQHVRETAAAILAVGLDGPGTAVFCQSAVCRLFLCTEVAITFCRCVLAPVIVFAFADE